MLGAGAGEHVHLFRRVLQPFLVEPIDGGAGDDVVGIGQRQAAGDGAGGDRVVAGDHLDPDAGGLAAADGVDRFLARWIDQPKQTE